MRAPALAGAPNVKGPEQGPFLCPPTNEGGPVEDFRHLSECVDPHCLLCDPGLTRHVTAWERERAEWLRRVSERPPDWTAVAEELAA